jgi:arsenite methyltransferase
MKTKPPFGLKSTHVNFDIDTPGPVGVFLIVGLTAALLSVFLSRHSLQWMAGGMLGLALIIGGLVFFGIGFLMVVSGGRGKLRACGKILDSLHLKGSERLLDAGCGRGLVLIEAAKKLPRGRTVGLDDWSQKGLLRNDRERTLLNARLERVEGRIDVKNGDMRKMPFPRNHFDVVVSRLALHRIGDREGRREALGEMVRVLRKGGRLGLQDFEYRHQTAEDLARLRLKDIRITGLDPFVFPPLWLITAKK